MGFSEPFLAPVWIWAALCRLVAACSPLLKVCDGPSGVSAHARTRGPRSRRAQWALKGRPRCLPLSRCFPAPGLPFLILWLEDGLSCPALPALPMAASAPQARPWEDGGRKKAAGICPSSWRGVSLPLSLTLLLPLARRGWRKGERKLGAAPTLHIRSPLSCPQAHRGLPPGRSARVVPCLHFTVWE